MLEPWVRESGQGGIGDLMRQPAQFDDLDVGLFAMLDELLLSRFGEQGGEHTCRGRLSESRRNGGDLLAHALLSSLAASRAATRLRWVGASGTCAGLRAANSLRNTGTVSYTHLRAHETDSYL